MKINVNAIPNWSNMAKEFDNAHEHNEQLKEAYEAGFKLCGEKLRAELFEKYVFINSDFKIEWVDDEN